MGFGGSVARCVVRPPLPYVLRFDVAVERVVPAALVETTVSGDIEGPARLELSGDGDGAEARLVWEVDVRDPLLRTAARVARPLMEWGHEWVVDIDHGRVQMYVKGKRNDCRRSPIIAPHCSLEQMLERIAPATPTLSTSGNPLRPHSIEINSGSIIASPLGSQSLEGCL